MSSIDSSSSSTPKLHWLGIYVRGIAMGAADVVPGVSGGTVAFITGIYEELLGSIKSINPKALQVLIKRGPQACWQHINGNFLLALMAGMLTSVLSLARLISFLLAEHPLLVWSFFFGLIVASSIYMIRQVKQWQLAPVLALVVGTVAAALVGELKPSELNPDLLMVFAAGCVAICAMILPGISGSFILVLLGMYSHVLNAVRDLQWVMLLCFAAGCGVGLLSFSHLLSWLFSRFHDVTLSLLTGFLIGSLSLVWPWKETLSYYQNSKGESRALEQQNVLPGHFESLSGSNAQTLECVGLMLAGLILVVGLERISQKSALAR